MKIETMKAVSDSLMGNGKTSENSVAHMWAMTAEVCQRLENGPDDSFRPYDVDPRNLREVVIDPALALDKPSRWQRLKDWFFVNNQPNLRQ
jgi:hypothetical protein